METIPTGPVAFARLVPINIDAMSLFSRAVEYMTMKSDQYHLLFVGGEEYSQDIQILGSRTVSDLEVEVPGEVEGEVSEVEADIKDQIEDGMVISDHVAQQVKNKGSFILSFEAPPRHPKRGWRLGLGRDGCAHRDVDFMLGWDRGPSSRHVAPIHLHLRFNRCSGILLLIAVSQKPVELFTEREGWVSLKHGEQRALHQLTNLIRLGEYRFDLVYALPQGEDQTDDYLANKKVYFKEKLGTRLPDKDPWMIPSKANYSNLGHVLSYNTLGYGAFGWISNGIDTVTGDPVAIKEISIKKRDRASVSDIQALQREVELGKSFQDCGHVAPILRAWCEHNRDAYCGGVDEKVYLTSPLGLRDFDSLDFAQLPHLKDMLRLVRGTLQGLAEIHARGIMHRDIQTKNLLVMSLEPPKGVIIDFGKATKAEWADSTFIGPKHTLAPEVWGDSGYTNKVDIWSWAYAMTVKLGYWIPRDYPPIQPERTRAMRQYLTVLAGRSDSLLADLIDLLLRMLQMEPGDRPTAEEALRAKCWDAIKEDVEPRDEEMAPQVKRRKVDAEASREIQEARTAFMAMSDPSGPQQGQSADWIKTHGISSSVIRGLISPK